MSTPPVVIFDVPGSPAYIRRMRREAKQPYDVQTSRLSDWNLGSVQSVEPPTLNHDTNPDVDLGHVVQYTPESLSSTSAAPLAVTPTPIIKDPSVSTGPTETEEVLTGLRDCGTLCAAHSQATNGKTATGDDSENHSRYAPQDSDTAHPLSTNPVRQRKMQIDFLLIKE
ncbi:hypothetical protein D9613_003706 [Agrocybe pediades]|uniref:Uncharacterized protein n=1 Tax=Agrocybe pediades TaxID=84607 RepID=A0A8H4VLJ9_9AGAR|nr:hypothetical protein D9613_003706 [Agrocybe pediades]